MKTRHRHPAPPSVAALIVLSWLMVLGAACGSSPEATATRKVADSALPTATPAPNYTAQTGATPKPRAGLRIVELDPAYEPIYADGLEYAASGPNMHLYLVDVETGETEQITRGTDLVGRAAFSASHVAWVSARRRIEIPGLDSRPPFNYSSDIFILDRATGKEKRITETPADRRSLDISGEWLVWQDTRNEMSGGALVFDIYAYNLRTGKETPVAVAPGSQESPAIHGSTVVWADNRNSPVAGTPEAHCSNCPENRFDIYAMNLDTGEERVLVRNGYLNRVPDIFGDHLAWQSFEAGRPSEIRVLDLRKFNGRKIAQEGNSGATPSLSEQYMVWSTSDPCDPREEEHPSLTGVFAMRLATGETWKLSGRQGTATALSGNMVVIRERCPGGAPAYAVFLE